MTLTDRRPTTLIEPRHPRIAVIGGEAQMPHGVRQRCAQAGLVFATPGDVRILVDMPVRVALTTLMQQPITQPTVVWTTNTSLAYCADLWDLHPTVLLAGAAPDLVTAVYAAASGDGYCEPQLDLLPLTPKERRILQQIAVGRTNREIAEALAMHEQTIANGVSRILAKLDLSNRCVAALLYWGLKPTPVSTSWNSAQIVIKQG